MIEAFRKFEDLQHEMCGNRGYDISGMFIILILRRLSLLAFLALLAGSPRTAQAREIYYVLIFGSQSRPKRLSYTHTWATFVKATGEGSDPNAYAIEANTISWMPATLDVRVFRPWPEPGVNLDLEQTLRVVCANGESVTMWGPFVVGPEVYRKSLSVQGIIASGALR